jgi:pseudouridine synthase
MPERLQKLIARAGIASRRQAELLIQSGAVRVNGEVVKTLGTKADPARDRIQVGSRLLRFPERPLYLLLHKPRGTVTTASDPQRRRTVFHFLPGIRERVFSVGRLPYEVEGLLILTSDGEFADALLRGRLPQTYWFKVKGALEPEVLARLERQAGRARLRQGFGGQAKAVKPGANPWYEVTLTEPRGDRLRTALFRSGHPVEKLKRVALGSLRDTRLRPGEFRELTEKEVQRLRREARPASAARRAG